MTFSQYINWILHNRENFQFVINIINNFSRIYQIYYTDPNTGLKRIVVNFEISENNAIDSITKLVLANVDEINLDLFENLCCNS